MTQQTLQSKSLLLTFVYFYNFLLLDVFSF